MPLPLSEQVVVITGASSGIGREAALRFGRNGAAVVLIAREQQALREVEREITAEGGRAFVMPADVADYGQVERAARSAAQHFGRIDTWVNNAAVTVYGRFEDVQPQEFRRVLEVNVMGQVHGARAALPHLKQSHGTLIGIGSVLSQVPMPLLTAYTTSKHALKGFYDSLRIEQMHDKTGVQVSFLMPDSTNTPLFDHAMTHLGVKPGPFPPVYEPDMVAEAILRAAQSPVRDEVLTASATMMAALDALAPRYSDRMLEGTGYSRQLTTEPKAPSGPSNLWQPVPGSDAARGTFAATPFDPLAWVRARPAVRSALTAVGLAAIAFPLAGFALRAAFGSCADLDVG